MKRACSVALATLLVATSAFAAIRWVRATVQAYGGTKTEAVDCGAITGLAGCVRGWDLVGTGKEWIVTDADLGGEWAKNGAQCQFEMTTALTKQPQDEHYHRYSYKSVASGTVYPTIRAQAIQVNNQDGLTWQKDVNDPQWWWTPNVVYTDRGIAIEIYDPAASSWGELPGGWSDTHQNTPSTYASQNTGQGPVPQGSGSNGEIRVATALPTVGADTHIRVSFRWKVTVAATVDNACVQQWQEVVTYTAYSALTTAGAGTDFDLDELIQ